MTDRADGVLPDDVSRDPRAESWLVFVDLAPGADVQAWLQQVATPAVNTLVSGQSSIGVAATCTVGFGSTLFDKANTAAQRPRGITTALPGEVPPDAHDVLFYVFALSDAIVATFLRSLSGGGNAARVTIERGYQRTDRREVFGQLDGLRNIPPADRAAVAFVGDDQPDEPPWSSGGSYLAYLKIKQNVSAWAALPAAEQAQIIGRQLDGSRLDLPAGTDPTTEPPFADPSTPATCSHVRKAGPRGPEQDPVRIFRRGTPFIECDSSGTLVEGLQFVSYQASIDDFLTILQRWMLNANFPANTAGVDSLIDPSRGLTTFLKGGVYFAVPHDDRFIGAGMFDPAGAVTSELVIHIAVVDSTNAPDPTASLEGAVFRVSGADGTVLATLTTDAAGHAVSPPLPAGVALTVTETTAPAGAQTSPGPSPQAITLERCAKSLLTFTNTRTGSTGGYGARTAQLPGTRRRLRRGVIEMLAVPAIGGVVAAGLALGHVHPDGLWRWLIAAPFVGPALLAQGRYTARHYDDRWASALGLLIAGTAIMTVLAWAAGFLAAAATAATWLFFHYDAFMNQIIAIAIVVPPISAVSMKIWRWLDAPTSAG